MFWYKKIVLLLVFSVLLTYCDSTAKGDPLNGIIIDFDLMEINAESLSNASQTLNVTESSLGTTKVPSEVTESAWESNTTLASRKSITVISAKIPEYDSQMIENTTIALTNGTTDLYGKTSTTGSQNVDNTTLLDIVEVIDDRQRIGVHISINSSVQFEVEYITPEPKTTPLPSTKLPPPPWPKMPELSKDSAIRIWCLLS